MDWFLYDKGLRHERVKFILLRSSHKLIAIQMFLFEYMIFFNHPRKRVLCNIRLSNLENVLQINLKIDKTKDCIFKVSGSTNFENLSAQHQPCWRLCRFDLCIGLPRKLWIRQCLVTTRLLQLQLVFLVHC